MTPERLYGPQSWFVAGNYSPGVDKGDNSGLARTGDNSGFDQEFKSLQQYHQYLSRYQPKAPNCAF